MNKLSQSFFNDYFLSIAGQAKTIDFELLDRILKLINNVQKAKKKIIFAGNGGSASIASHLTIDFINAAKIKAINFNEPSIITCFSNDYGYRNWISKAIESYADPGDLIILISSSGKSENMIFGAQKAKALGVKVVTLSGFSASNKLRRLGDVNLWVDSKIYNVVEMTHQIWLLSIVDYFVEFE